MYACIYSYIQCSKLLPVHVPEADNFGGGGGKIFLNFMFLIWDWSQEGWQLFWLSFDTVNVIMYVIYNMWCSK